MATGLLAKKVGMTQIFTPEGDCVPVTVLEAGPCTVVRRKTADKDGYDAVLLGWGTVDEKHAHRLTKPEVGVFKKAGTAVFRHLKEVRVKDAKLLGELRPATSSPSTRCSRRSSASTSPASRRAAASPAS
jgi:large subunit ribosomal protein L3